MTNNIKFNLEVINESTQNVSYIFVRINVCQLGENYDGLCLYEDSVLSMIAHAIYNPYLDAYENNQFQTTIYGTYQMIIDVPDNIGYSITLESISVTGSSFYLENSILPRKYYIVVTLTDNFIEEPWGQEKIVENISNMNDLDLIRTYQSGEMFSYQGQIYKVQEGFTYTYSSLAKPGTSALLGLVNMSYVYEQTSTYVAGDVVYYQNAYYECLLLNDLGYAPDVTGIGLGYYVLIT